MIDQNINPVLRTVMQKIYQSRRPLPEIPRTVVRHERVNDQAFCEVWFMTPGCFHDQKGGCTMCNYGKGRYVNPDDILSELKTQFEALPTDVHELIVTPIGSMLDEQEVPQKLFEQILGLLKTVRTNEFFIETRLDTIFAEKLEQIRQSIHADRIYIEMGLEAYDEWVLRNCVNKNLDLTQIPFALQTIHRAGMFACANIGIGIPFLNERTSIAMAIRSVNMAFQVGFDSVVLFPYHVKPGTLSAWLWKRGLYRCCSLWALIEVLRAFPPELLDRIHISWYRNYYEDPGKILASPTTCDKCCEDILKLLDAYKNHPGKEAQEALCAASCECRDLWWQQLLSSPNYVVMDQLAAVYRQMGHTFGISKDAVEKELISMARGQDRYAYV